MMDGGGEEGRLVVEFVLASSEHWLVAAVSTVYSSSSSQVVGTRPQLKVADMALGQMGLTTTTDLSNEVTLIVSVRALSFDSVATSLGRDSLKV